MNAASVPGLADLTPTLARRLHEACNRFEAAWRGGARPSLDDSLAGAGDDLVPVLLRELIHLDVWYRRQYGEQPRAEDYQARFPTLDADWLAEAVTDPEAAVPAAGARPSEKARPGDQPNGQAAPVLPPGAFGGYELLGEIGRGGMGVVYQARQAHPARLVALKVILAGAHADAERRGRFLAEADAIARLQHPHIVQIHHAGDRDGLPFLALEYVGSGNLAQRLGGAPLAPRPAAALLEKLARAVQYAHEHGIVHRDLKPANVLLAADGTPKITDFGLAKQEGAGLTATGALLGTPGYMAPEQAAGKGKEVGAPADVWALGAILYECLTGRPPFAAATALDTLAQVLAEEPVPPRRLNRQVPRDLETVCLKCLRKDARQRYASAQDLADDLGRWLRGEPVRAPPVGLPGRTWRWCRRRPAVAGLSAAVVTLLLLLLTGLLFTVGWLRFRVQTSEEALQWLAYRDEARAARYSGRPGQRQAGLAAIRKAAGLPVPPGHTRDELRTEALACLCLLDLEELHSWQGCPEGAAHFAIDPTLTAYARVDTSGQVSIRRIDDDSEVGHFITSMKAAALQLSPGARFIRVDCSAPGAPAPMELWRRTDTRVEPVRSQSSVIHYCVAFSPDNRLLACLPPDGNLVVYDVEAGAPLGRWSMPVERLVSPPAFSQDSRRLAVGAVFEGWPPAVEVRDVQDGKVVARLPQPGTCYGIAWRPDGRRLAVGCADGKIHFWDVVRQQDLGAWVGHREAGVRPLTFNGAGTQLASTDWGGLLRVWDVESRLPLFVTPLGHSLPSQTEACGISADGSLRLVEREGLYGLRLLRLVGGREHRRFAYRSPQGEYGNVWPTFTDGRLLIALGRFQNHDPGRLAVIDTDGGRVLGELPLVSGRPTAVLGLDPSGGLLTYEVEGYGVIRWPVRGGSAGATLHVGPPRRLERIRGRGNVWGASDGCRVIAVPEDDGAVVCRLDAPGRWTRLRRQYDVRGCAVSPDGSWAVTASQWGVPGASGCKVWRAADGLLVREVPLPNLVLAAAFSPDGRWLGTSASGSGVRLWRVGTWEEGPLLSEGENGLAFAPDGRTVAVGDQNGSVHLCATDSGTELARLELAEQTPFWPVAFSRDGGSLFAKSQVDGVLHAWDLRLLRRELTEMGLDWDAPPLPDPASGPLPEVEVDPGAIAAFSPPPQETPEQRVARCTTILRADPDDVEAYHERGQAYDVLGRRDEAIADFSEALKRRPDDAGVLAARAADRIALKQYGAAAADLERALALKADDASACDLLARLHARGLAPASDSKRALALAERAVRLAPQEADYRGTLGMAYYANGRYRQAVAPLEESLKGPSAGLHLLYLAMCHHRLGDAAKAKEWFDRAVRWAEDQKLPAERAEHFREYRAVAEKVLGAPL